MVSNRCPPTRFSPPLIAKIRAMFVLKGVGPTEIAKQLNLKPMQISTMANRYGWIDERNQRAQKLIKQAESRASDDHAAFLASMSAHAEELAEDSMGVARDAIGQGLGATRELQQASQSAKNFVDIYFKANRLDATQGGTQINVGSLFCNLGADTTGVSPPGKRSEKVVTDVSAESAQGSADADTRLITGTK